MAKKGAGRIDQTFDFACSLILGRHRARITLICSGNPLIRRGLADTYKLQKWKPTVFSVPKSCQQLGVRRTKTAKVTTFLIETYCVIMRGESLQEI